MTDERIHQPLARANEAAPQNQRLIRPIAICVFRREDEILVFQGYDAIKGDLFYRPLGGGIEFSESSREAVAREIREELGAEITNLRHLATTENIFTLNGHTGHEIVFLYEADLEDRSLYKKESISATEDDGTQIKAVWKPMDDFQTGQFRLVPEGLLELLLQNR